jgi:hypothetical protein
MTIYGPMFCLEEYRTESEIRDVINRVFRLIYKRCLIAKLMGFNAVSLSVENIKDNHTCAPDVTIVRFCVDMHHMEGKEVQVLEFDHSINSSLPEPYLRFLKKYTLGVAKGLTVLNGPASESDIESLHRMVDGLRKTELVTA